MTEAALKSVVYVDDEPHIRMLAETCLTRVGGLDARIFASGVSFLADAADLSPQMVLLDVMMPDLDGPETLLAMRRLPHLAQVPVVFVTAKTRASERDRLKQLGALEVIAKPFRPMTIADELKTLWSRHQAVQTTT